MSERRNEIFPNRGLEGYFFATPALRLRLDLVQDYIERGTTPVLIAGTSGAGKSMFLNQLVGRADHGWRVVRIPPVPSFSPYEVTTFLNAELRLPARASMEEMLREFESWLGRIAVRGRIAVVCIDDAHALSDESLGHLAKLPECARSNSCRVLMTGLPCLRARLAALLGRSSVRGQVINIPCLDPREVASYIDMKLYHAGMEDRLPFGRKIIDDIARSSRGCPGRIDAMAGELLNGGHGVFKWRRASDRLWRLMRGLTAGRDACHL